MPGQVWILDQLLGALYVHVPLRSTILKIKGGLFVFDTVAPTPECISLVSTHTLPASRLLVARLALQSLRAETQVRELEKEHGPVKHVLLASAAIEHKRTAGPFSRNFPIAQVALLPPSEPRMHRRADGGGAGSCGWRRTSTHSPSGWRTWAC